MLVRTLSMLLKAAVLSDASGHCYLFWLLDLLILIIFGPDRLRHLGQSISLPIYKNDSTKCKQRQLFRIVSLIDQVAIFDQFIPLIVSFCFQLVPGPPFVFGAFLVICGLLVAAFIPENPKLLPTFHIPRRNSGKQRCCISKVIEYG